MRQAAQRSALVLLVVAVTVALDQWTKVWATRALEPLAPQSYLHDLFRLEYARNPGAFLSLGAGMSPALRFWVLTVAVFVAMVALLVATLLAKRLTLLPRCAYALMIAGGLSNWWDRLARDGRVTDFMNLGIGRLRTGIFNVADLAIVAGVVMLVLFPGTAHKA